MNALLIAGGLGLVALWAFSSKKKKGMPGGSTGKPGGGTAYPSADSCDDAYSALPPMWQGSVDDAVSTAAKSGSALILRDLADLIEKAPDIDPATAKTVAACLRKNAAAFPGPGGGSSTDDGGGTLVKNPGGFDPGGFDPSLPGGVKLPGGFDPSKVSSLFEPSGSLPAPPTPFDPNLPWPAVEALPEPYRSQAMMHLDHLDYWAARDNRLSFIGGTVYRDQLRKVYDAIRTDPSLAYIGSPVNDAAEELMMAMNVLYLGGY